MHQKHRTFNTATKYHPKPNQANVKYVFVFLLFFFEWQLLLYTNINKKVCKLVCKNQCLKNGLSLNVSDFSMSLTNRSSE